MTSLRKITLGVVALVLVGLLGYGGWRASLFYRQNLSGAAPAVLPATQDISELVDTNETPLSLPSGFSLKIFAKGLGGPRVIVTDPKGVVVVSVPASGKVVALPDNDGDGKADTAVTVVSGLKYPHGLAFRCVGGTCKLYIAEENALASYDYNVETQTATNRTLLVSLPDGGEHVTRSLIFLPPPNEATLLVAIGSSCNACKESDPRRAAISQINVETGKALTPYVTGMRNSVFQAIDPLTQHVWGTENGRDFLGNDLPPDELNIITEGHQYGWPNCYGQNVLDKSVDAQGSCAGKAPAQVEFHAHSAPLGIAFIQGQGWPSEYQNDLFVAFHGSWNSTVPTGYKVVRVKLDENGASQGIEDFLTGFLTAKGQTYGRPVGLLVKSDGELFVTDDKSGVVYRVSATN